MLRLLMGTLALLTAHSAVPVSANTGVLDTAVLTGVVRDARTGDPLAAVRVVVTHHSAPPRELRTDSNGRYLVTLPPGNYYVAFDPDARYADQWAVGRHVPSDSESITLRPREVRQIDANLQRVGSISGKVTDAAGRALSGVCVSAFVTVPVFDHTGPQACTDSQGRYRLTELREGSYPLRFYDRSWRYGEQWWRGKSAVGVADRVRVVGWRDTGGVNPVMRRAGAITGTVRDRFTGRPVAGVCANVHERSTGALVATNPEDRRICSGRDGRYLVTGVAPGRQLVRFWSRHGSHSPLWYRNATTWRRAATVPVVEGRATGRIDVTLLPSGSITGTITDTQGRPLRGMCATVGVYDAAADMEDVPLQPSSCTGADGRYHIRKVEPGRYTVQFFDLSGRHASQYWPGVPRRSAATRILVRAAKTTGDLNAQLQPAGRVEGTVTERLTGAPVRGVCVYAYDASDNLPVGVTVLCTGASGRYAVGGLPTTTVKLELFSFGRDYRNQWAISAPDRASASVIEVQAGRATKVDDRMDERR